MTSLTRVCPCGYIKECPIWCGNGHNTGECPRDTAAERDQLAYLLYVLYYDMHPTYGNTSTRGRGIGGQAMTQQCSVIHPEGDSEISLLERIDGAIRAQFRRAEQEGYSLLPASPENPPPSADLT